MFVFAQAAIRVCAKGASRTGRAARQGTVKGWDEADHGLDGIAEDDQREDGAEQGGDPGAGATAGQ